MSADVERWQGTWKRPHAVPSLDRGDGGEAWGVGEYDTLKRWTMDAGFHEVERFVLNDIEFTSTIEDRERCVHSIGGCIAYPSLGDGFGHADSMSQAALDELSKPEQDNNINSGCFWKYYPIV